MQEEGFVGFLVLGDFLVTQAAFAAEEALRERLLEMDLAIVMMNGR